MKIAICTSDDAELLLQYNLDNAERFARWNPAVNADFYTLEWWQFRVEEWDRRFMAGTEVHFLGVDETAHRLIGVCSLTNIVYSAASFCFMGYSVDRREEGTGAMTKIVEHTIRYAFDVLNLNRISASYMPVNLRSGRLLTKLGFEKEGYSKRLLKINGQWEDHINTALLNPHPDFL
ncbi:MAG: GNAT family N-acetyltransferase [Pseudomonadota bacterium]